MIVLQVVALGAAMMVALFYFGYGATRLLLPRLFDEWRGWITPLTGLALIVTWDYIALYFGFNLTTATSALFALVTLVNGIVLWQERDELTARLRQTRLLPRDGIILAALAFIAFLASVAPLFRYGYVTIIGENWDYEFYLPLADLLKEMPTAAIAQFPPNPLVNVILSPHILPLPLGFTYLQTSLDVLFGKDAIDTFAILMGVVRALLVISPFVFFRATLKMSNRAALVASALLTLNGLALWFTYWNFGIHLTSLALLPLALAFGVEALLGHTVGRGDAVSSPNRGNLRPKTALWLPRPIPAGLFLAAINVTYHPSLIAALLPLGVIGLYALIVQKDRVRTILNGALLLIIGAALSFPTLFHLDVFRREYYSRTRLVIGLRDFVPPSDTYGFSLYTIDLAVGHTIPTLWLFQIAERVWDIAAPILFIAAIAASLYTLWQLRRDHERRAIWYILVASSVFYILLFRLPFLRPYPYGYLKALSLGSYILIALVVAGMEIGDWGLETGNQRLKIQDWGSRLTFDASRLTFDASRFSPLVSRFSPRRSLAQLVSRFSFLMFAAILLLSTALTLFTFAISLEQYFKPAPPFFNADDLRLRELRLIVPEISTVFLTDRAEAQKIPMGLVAYMLRGYELHGTVTTGFGQLENMDEGAVYDYALLTRGEDPTTRGYADTPRWSNARYALYPRAPGVLVHRAVNADLSAQKPLALTLSADQVMPGTKKISDAPGVRGVRLAFASFVPQTAIVSGGIQQVRLKLAPGLSVYDVPQLAVPQTLSIAAEDSPGRGEMPQIPHQLPNKDGRLYVPWIELRDPTGGNQSNMLYRTNALLVRCTNENASELDARCFVANSDGVSLRWQWIVRGTVKGSYEEQVLALQGAMGAPRESMTISATARAGLSALTFDDAPPIPFPFQKLPDGKWRGSVQLLRGDALLAELDLYTFTIEENGTKLTRTSPSSAMPVIVQP